MTISVDSQIKNDIRARELLQAFLNERGVNPEVHIWQDEERAYIASDAAQMYPLVAAALNVGYEDDDRSFVNDELMSRYEQFREEAERLIRDETAEREDVNDGSQRESWLHTWEGKDGYYYCFSGINRDGLYSESEDVGPFESREEASASAHEAMESMNDA